MVRCLISVGFLPYFLAQIKLEEQQYTAETKWHSQSNILGNIPWGPSIKTHDFHARVQVQALNRRFPTNTQLHNKIITFTSHFLSASSVEHTPQGKDPKAEHGITFTIVLCLYANWNSIHEYVAQYWLMGNNKRKKVKAFFFFQSISLKLSVCKKFV